MIRTLLARGTVLVACSVLVSTGIASAAWTKAGTGAGAGSSTSLAAPTGVSAATVAPTSSAIDVTFSPATNPTGTTYTVTRDKTKSGAAGPQVACSGLTASPCHDTGLSSGITFTYSLTAVLGSNWVKVATTTPSATTTVSNPTVTSPTTASPVVVTKGTTANVTVTGTGFQSGITGVIVTNQGAFTLNSVTFVSATQVTLNVTVTSSNNKVDGFRLTNPDGGVVTCTNCLKSSN